MDEEDSGEEEEEGEEVCGGGRSLLDACECALKDLLSLVSFAPANASKGKPFSLAHHQDARRHVVEVLFGVAELRFVAGVGHARGGSCHALAVIEAVLASEHGGASEGLRMVMQAALSALLLRPGVAAVHPPLTRRPRVLSAVWLVGNHRSGVPPTPTTTVWTAWGASPAWWSYTRRASTCAS